jgi:hypothetical protein
MLLLTPAADRPAIETLEKIECDIVPQRTGFGLRGPASDVAPAQRAVELYRTAVEQIVECFRQLTRRVEPGELPF